MLSTVNTIVHECSNYSVPHYIIAMPLYENMDAYKPIIIFILCLITDTWFLNSILFRLNK